MQIAYFSNQFPQKSGHGISRYSQELFSELQRARSKVTLIPTATWSDLSTEEIEELKSRSGLVFAPAGRRITPLVWNLTNLLPIESYIPTIDAVHALSLGYRVATKKPYIVTVHDIGPLTHPEFFKNKPPWIMRRALEQMISRNGPIICVSHATADDLSHFVRSRYNQDITSRISTIHEGVRKDFFHQPESDPGSKSFKSLAPYFLSVGKASPRKNNVRVIKAFLKVAEEVPHNLVVAGGVGWNDSSMDHTIKSSKFAHRIKHLGFVSESDLKQLYRGAAAFVYPSLFEGFGLPILEAMAAGCPVITSNISSMPEVAGEAALLVNPRSIEEIADGLLLLAQDEDQRVSLKMKGQSRAKQFTWEKTAEAVLTVYSNL